MLIAFVIRLATSGLAAGHLVGDVEHVPSGGRGSFRDADQLTAWCAHAAHTVPAAPPAPRVDSDTGAPAGASSATPGDPS